MSKIINVLSDWFCREFHHEITRPVNGKYCCIKCGRSFNSPWR
jgi:hypothetical protein